MGFNGAFSGGGSGGSGAPGPQGPEGPQGEPGPGVPAGGSVGQYPRKSGAPDYALEWATAAQTRTDLGLGTAAVLDTGTSSGNVVVLGMGGSLPSVDGSNLTGIVSSQISGLGTAASYAAAAFLQTANNLSDVSPLAARGNLGLGSAATQDSTAFQAANANLTACAGLTSGADLGVYFTGSGTAGTFTLTSFGRSLMDDADASTARTTLGLGTAATQASTAFQGADATLTALAGLTTGADLGIYFTGTDTASTFTLTAAGRALLDDADAAAQRTTLGLGTAATANTGTGSGNIPVLDGSSRLPAVDGSQLTGITSTQVSGLGTAAGATLGTSANNVPQLDGSGVLPQVAWAPETWTNRWRASDGDPTSNGFSQAGTQNMVIASTTQDGVACYSLTPGASAGTSYIQAAWTAANASWEMYAKVWIPDSSTTGPVRLCISYSPGTTASGSKRIEIGLSATQLLVYTGAALSSLVTIPDFTDKWIDLLVQCYQSADGAANSWWRISIGRLVIYSGPPGTIAGTAGAGAGTFYIGRISTGSQVTPFYVAEMAIRTALNAAPPEYRFGASTWPL